MIVKTGPNTYEVRGDPAVTPEQQMNASRPSATTCDRCGQISSPGANACTYCSHPLTIAPSPGEMSILRWLASLPIGTKVSRIPEEELVRRLKTAPAVDPENDRSTREVDSVAGDARQQPRQETVAAFA